LFSFKYLLAYFILAAIGGVSFIGMQQASNKAGFRLWHLADLPPQSLHVRC
jgi:hypothetical protein